ncbi:MAG: flagella basal body P-ring formation protein FlgA [Myxococcota bacterium]
MTSRTTMRHIGLALGLAAACVLSPSLDAEAKGRVMKAKDLVHTVSEQVKAGLPSELLLEEIELPKGFAVPHGSVVEIKWRKKPAEGNAWVLVSASVDDKVKRRAFAKVELVGIHHVLVAQRALSRGQIVRAGDLRLQPQVGAKGITLAPIALVGAPVLDDVAAGDVVTGATVGLPAPISRGTSIKVVSQAGRVRVTAQARLETTARPGERARARIIATRQIVRGQLIDEHTLVVSEGERR